MKFTLTSKSTNDLCANLLRLANKSALEAVNAKKLRGKVDELTNASPKKKNEPPAEIKKLFETAVSSALQSLSSANRFATFSSSMTYLFAKGKWTAIPRITVDIETQTRGGGSHRVKAGDTLWSIAKSVYGSGIYAGEISEFNQKTMKNPNLILVGTAIKLPKIPVPKKEKADTLFKAAALTSKRHFGLEPTFLALPCYIGKTDDVVVRQVYPLGKQKLFVEARMSGQAKLTRSKIAYTPIKIINDKVEVQKDLSTTVGAISYKLSPDLKNLSLSSKLGNTTAKVNWDIKTGSFGVEIEQTKTIVLKGQGEVEVSISFKAVGRLVDQPERKQKTPQEVWASSQAWLKENRTAVICTMGVLVFGLTIYLAGPLAVAALSGVSAKSVMTYGVAVTSFPMMTKMVIR